LGEFDGEEEEEDKDETKGDHLTDDDIKKASEGLAKSGVKEIKIQKSEGLINGELKIQVAKGVNIPD
jgi:hypothetical protein